MSVLSHLPLELILSAKASLAFGQVISPRAIGNVETFWVYVASMESARWAGNR